MPLWPKSGTFLFQCSPRPQDAIWLANAGHHLTMATFPPGRPDFRCSARIRCLIIIPHYPKIAGCSTTSAQRPTPHHLSSTRVHPSVPDDKDRETSAWCPWFSSSGYKPQRPLPLSPSKSQTSPQRSLSFQPNATSAHPQYTYTDHEQRYHPPIAGVLSWHQVPAGGRCTEATPVMNLLFLARLDLYCQARCVLHLFQHQNNHVLLAHSRSWKFLAARFSNKCCSNCCVL